MTVYATIDTNVVLAALLSKKSDTATVMVIKAVMNGQIIPLVHEDILTEYEEVLHREKFHLHEDTIQTVLHSIRHYGKTVNPKPTGEILADADDLIFYEVTVEKREDNAYLVTGNQRHYPTKNFIISPAQMMKILNNI